MNTLEQQIASQAKPAHKPTTSLHDGEMEHEQEKLDTSKAKDIELTEFDKAVQASNQEAAVNGSPTGRTVELLNKSLFEVDEYDLNSVARLYSRTVSASNFLQKKGAGVAGGLFNAARIAQEQSPATARGAFLKMVLKAEVYICSDLAGMDKMETKLFVSEKGKAGKGAWPAAVRKVKLGFDYGLDFSEYSSLSAIEKKCTALAEEARDAKDAEDVAEHNAQVAKDLAEKGLVVVDGVEVPDVYGQYIEYIHENLLKMAEHGKSEGLEDFLQATQLKIANMLVHFQTNAASIKQPNQANG